LDSGKHRIIILEGRNQKIFKCRLFQPSVSHHFKSQCRTGEREQGNPTEFREGDSVSEKLWSIEFMRQMNTETSYAEMMEGAVG
jgi:hypothetical protein